MGITTVSVTVNPAPTVSISGSVSICLGNHATLASSSGVNYSWSTVPVQTTQSISDNPSTTTTYSVTVANSFGCTATATHTVNVSSITPQITGGNTTICSGNTTTLTASGGTSYTWITSPSQTTASITVAPTTTTSYSVFVTNSIGCSGMATATVNVNSSLLSSISANSTTLCPGTNTSITISASGGTTYSWSTGQTTTSIIVSPLFPFGPHTYSVAISNGSCTADTSITITVLTPPNISISTTPSTPTICSGDAITLTGGGGTFYFWGAAYGSPPSIVVYPTVTSTYTVIGQNVNSNSCYNFASVNVTVNSITAIVGNNITICPGFTAQLSATAGGDTTGLSYNWYNSSDSLIHSSNNPYFSVNPNVTTFYLVSATNGLSCNSANDTVWVFVDANNNCAIHIYNGITPNGDGKNDTWYIDGIQSFPDNVVDIFNRWGEKVWEGAHYDNDKGSDHVIWKGHNQSGQPLPAGTYYYVIDINGKRFASGWVELTR
jgi:gliding motility-associated-like protein